MDTLCNRTRQKMNLTHKYLESIQFICNKNLSWLEQLKLMKAAKEDYSILYQRFSPDYSDMFIPPSARNSKKDVYEMSKVLNVILYNKIKFHKTSTGVHPV